MTPRLQALLIEATPLIRAAPLIGGLAVCDFGPDGTLYVDGYHGNNTVSPTKPNLGTGKPPASCVITSTLDALAKLETGDLSVEWALITGQLSVSGDTAIAIALGTALQKGKK